MAQTSEAIFSEREYQCITTLNSHNFSYEYDIRKAKTVLESYNRTP